MKPLQTSELAYIRAEAVDSFNCKLKVGTIAITQDSLGDIISTPTLGTEIAGGLCLLGGKEILTGSLTELPIDATLRLAHGTVITAKSQVTVTSLNGVTVSLVFNVVSEPKMGVSAIVVDLKRVIV